MVALKLEKGVDREIIPDSTAFEATVLSVEQKDSRWLVNPDNESEGYKQELNFKVQLIDPNNDAYDKRWLWGSCTAWLSDSPQNKLRQWAIAILDLDLLPEGYILETDDFVGKQCRVIVEQWTSKDGEKTGNAIKDFRPTKGNRAEAPAAETKSAAEFRADNAVEDLDDEPF